MLSCGDDSYIQFLFFLSVFLFFVFFMRYFFLFLLVLLLACIGFFFFFFFWIRYNVHTNTVNLTYTAVVQKLQELKELTTAEMTIQKIIKWKKDLVDILPTKKRDDTISSFLFKDNILMTVEAKVIAGIDMWFVINSWITINQDNSVSLLLPPAHILHVILTDKTQTVQRERWLFIKGDPTLETNLRNALIQQAKKEALSGWILDIANQKAHFLLRSLLETSGIRVKEIQTYQTQDINPVY